MKASKALVAKLESYASVSDALAETPEQAANLRTCAELMRQIPAIVKMSGWTQAEAAGQCGARQPRMNDLLRARVSRFSIDALVNISTAIGRTLNFDLQRAENWALRAPGGSRVLAPWPASPWAVAPTVVPGRQGDSEAGRGGS